MHYLLRRKPKDEPKSKSMYHVQLMTDDTRLLRELVRRKLVKVTGLQVVAYGLDESPQRLSSDILK